MCYFPISFSSLDLYNLTTEKLIVKRSIIYETFTKIKAYSSVIKLNVFINHLSINLNKFYCKPFFHMVVLPIYCKIVLLINNSSPQQRYFGHERLFLDQLHVAIIFEQLTNDQQMRLCTKEISHRLLLSLHLPLQSLRNKIIVTIKYHN